MNIVVIKVLFTMGLTIKLAKNNYCIKRVLIIINTLQSLSVSLPM